MRLEHLLSGARGSYPFQGKDHAGQNNKTKKSDTVGEPKTEAPEKTGSTVVLGNAEKKRETRRSYNKSTSEDCYCYRIQATPRAAAAADAAERPTGKGARSAVP